MTNGVAIPGKICLAGEYTVLDGGISLALPTQYGQSFFVQPPRKEGVLSWTAKDSEGSVWFEAEYDLHTQSLLKASSLTEAKVLEGIFQVLCQDSNELPKEGISIEARLQFPRDYGLGSSSTLVVGISEILGGDPFKANAEVFGGSGYDIACGLAKSSVLFQLKEGEPFYQKVVFNPVFKDNLYFVYLNKKQSTQNAIKHYRHENRDSGEAVAEISEISLELPKTQTQNEFNHLIKRHEDILSEVLNLSPIQESVFPDFSGQMKWLGAWGGDFALASSELSTQETKEYFSQKGYPILYQLSDFIHQEL